MKKLRIFNIPKSRDDIFISNAIQKDGKESIYVREDLVHIRGTDEANS